MAGRLLFVPPSPGAVGTTCCRVSSPSHSRSRSASADSRARDDRRRRYPRPRPLPGLEVPALDVTGVRLQAAHGARLVGVGGWSEPRLTQGEAVSDGFGEAFRRGHGRDDPSVMSLAGATWREGQHAIRVDLISI